METKKKFIELHKIDDWQKLQNSNQYSEIILFKFSPYCSISYRADKIFSKWFDNLDENKDIAAVKIDVISAKNVSREIAENLKVEHESPQIIWLDDNKNVKWTGSHFEINENSLNSQLD